MRVIILTIILITMAVAKHYRRNRFHNSILVSKDNFFNIINKDVHNLMEKVFSSMHLNKNFSKEPNIKLLLTIHYDLTNIINKNLESLFEIKNLTRVYTANQTESMARLNRVVEKVLKNCYLGIYNQKKGKKRDKNLTNPTIEENQTSNSSREFGNSQEFMGFVTDFLQKINNITENDFKPVNRIVPSRRNLKIWVPPSSFAEPSVNISRRVFSGMKTSVKKFPFMVSIHIMGEFACSGSIIGRDYIITAASCLQVAYQNKFFQENPKAIYVRLGSNYIMGHGETIPVQKVHFHPRYSPNNLKHNLAIIQLEKRIRFKKEKKRIRRIMWDKTPAPLPMSSDGVIILGWGAEQNKVEKKKDRRLSVDVLDSYDLKECADVYSDFFVSSEHFCAGFVKIGGGACAGDIGGPGVVGAVLMGVVSFGAPVCGTVDAPTVFTKLGYYKPWIEGIVGLQYTREDKYTRRAKEPQLINFAANPGVKFKFNRVDYPDEIKTLRDILVELVQTDDTVVQDLLYGDFYEDFKDIFRSAEKKEDIQNSLINQSTFTRPDIFYDMPKKSPNPPLNKKPPVHPNVTNEPAPLNLIGRTPALPAEPEYEDNESTENYDESGETKEIEIMNEIYHYGLDSIMPVTTTTLKYEHKKNKYKKHEHFKIDEKKSNIHKIKKHDEFGEKSKSKNKLATEDHRKGNHDKENQNKKESNKKKTLDLSSEGASSTTFKAFVGTILDKDREFYEKEFEEKDTKKHYNKHKINHSKKTLKVSHSKKTTEEVTKTTQETTKTTQETTKTTQETTKTTQETTTHNLLRKRGHKVKLGITSEVPENIETYIKAFFNVVI